MDPEVALSGLRFAYQELEREVVRALDTQLGDAQQLAIPQSRAMALLQYINTHQHLIPTQEELVASQQSIQNMIHDLDEGCHLSLDPAPNDATIITASAMRLGRRGRPRIEINLEVLEYSLNLRGPYRLAPTFGCSARTIRRRALESGISDPGQPVYTRIENLDGTLNLVYTAPNRIYSEISDEQLLQLVASGLAIFPHFGRRLMDGYLKSLGYTVMRDRIRWALEEIRGAPAVFGSRPIRRIPYRVPGPNSLWHHDGQHGLIRYKMVIHMFVDGFSRLVTAIQVNNNNRAGTVLELFHAARSIYGTPSRIRGDHGVENIGVAAWMEDNQGHGRGSYIFGRSVHNTRVERMWFDVTEAFGFKWRLFFHNLEIYHNLQPDLETHLWLLHYLFLEAINADALKWMEAWNSHTMTLPDQPSRSPRDMWFFGMIEAGSRGLNTIQEECDETALEDIQAYGIDWDGIDQANMVEHAPNPEEEEEVVVDEPTNIHQDSLEQFMCERLNQLQLDWESCDMIVRRTWWEAGIQLLNEWCRFHNLEVL
ncbi:integrase core domain protein [Ceratobasidium sp. AG-Ba]|nr:integrase core domain protein [Ceratobasidium sp. AG-Ba]